MEKTVGQMKAHGLQRGLSRFKPCLSHLLGMCVTVDTFLFPGLRVLIRNTVLVESTPLAVAKVTGNAPE